MEPTGEVENFSCNFLPAKVNSWSKIEWIKSVDQQEQNQKESKKCKLNGSN